MQPFIPRRRSRRRSISGRLIFLICGLVVTALIVGGVTQIGPQSGPYDTTLNQSFASLGSAAATESNTTAVRFRSLMTSLATQSRPKLEVQLDQLVQLTSRQATLAASAQASPALSRAQAEFADAFSERASAVLALRNALNALLGLRPLQIVGSPAAGSLVAAPTLVSSVVVATRITNAGALLTQSDRNYHLARVALRQARGHGRLPASVWVTQAQEWQPATVNDTVDQVVASPSLASAPRLVLSTVRLTPQVLPANGGANAVLPPTSTVSVTAVMTNVGTVDEPRAAVEFTLTPEAGGTTAGPVSITRREALATGASGVLPTVSFKVKPGQQYQLSVAIVLPAGQTDVSQTSQAEDLQIAPSTVPKGTSASL